MEGALSAGSGAAGLKLIETALWDGSVCCRRESHLARITAGAAALGWDCDRARVAAAMVGPAGQASRLRLTLDGLGQIEVQIAPLPPALSEWRLGLAPARLHSDDPWLGIKSTRRAAYDAARAALPAGLDEVIFCNERGEVCDGTITTVFFDRGAGLRTPPRSSGLLPGVLRADLLAAGQCREEILVIEDLARVRLWVGNALRGLVPAQWLG